MSRRKERRPYRKQKRADQEEETRRRITEAVVELHRTVGPAQTRVTDVADMAGVSRMTVYNQFPTEADLIEACSNHWSADNPTPDTSCWAAVRDPFDRIEVGLSELYNWYGRTADMMGNVLRDAPLVPPLAEVVNQNWQRFLDQSVDVLAEGWAIDDAHISRLRAALRLIVDFSTWRSFMDSDLDREDAALVGARMVRGVIRNSTPQLHGRKC